MIFQPELMMSGFLFDGELLSLGSTVLQVTAAPIQKGGLQALSSNLSQKRTENAIWAISTPRFSIQISIELRHLQVLDLSIFGQVLSIKNSREKTLVFRPALNKLF